MYWVLANQIAYRVVTCETFVFNECQINFLFLFSIKESDYVLIAKLCFQPCAPRKHPAKSSEVYAELSSEHDLQRETC